MKSLLSIIILLSVTTILRAQEVQVPFDSAGRIEVITSDMEDKLQLFPEYPNFQEARLYMKKDSSYFLEIRYTDMGQLTRNQIKETPEEVAELKKKVTEGLKNKAPGAFLDQSSRTKFVVWETILSTFVYSGLLISSFDVNNGAVGTGLVLVTGGLGFAVPYALTEKGEMTDGEASLALGGAFLGLGHGILLTDLIGKGGLPQGTGAIMTLASVGETIAGYYVAKNTNMSEGKADVIRYMGVFGGLQGLGLSYLIDNSEWTALSSGLTLLGSAGGFIVGTVIANSQHYTRGNASVLGTAGLFMPWITSSITASAIDYNSADSWSKGMVVAGMLGNAGGIALADVVMKNKHFSTEEGNYVILSTAAGWLAGTGLGFIITSGLSGNAVKWAFTVPSVLGTAAGFALMVGMLGHGSGKSTGSGWDVNFNPGALMGAILPQKHHSTNTNAYVPPALGVTYRW